MARGLRSRLERALPLLSGLALAMLALAPAAGAADSIYWGNIGTNNISFARLDGGGGGDLTISGATVNNPRGIAFDPAAGRLYWANVGGPTGVSSAEIDGANAVHLETSPGLGSASGIAVDHNAGRIYWADEGLGQIYSAALDGSGAAPINTSGTVVSQAWGVAVERSAGRVYWSNVSNNTISFANLDGSGGGTLNTTGATMNQPVGVAIDEATGRIFWANNGVNAISYANLDGSGGGTLPTTAGTVSQARGVAVDPVAGRVYWANVSGNSIAFARLDGSGGAVLATAGATTNVPQFPTLLEAPVAAGAPTVSGGSTTGSQLTCSSGSWAPDLIASNLYRAPRNFAYQWTRNGQPLAAGGSALAATELGRYACQATATNAAGAATQTSTAASVGGIQLGKLKLNRRNGSATLRVTVPGAGRIILSGKQVRRSLRKSGGPMTLTLKILPKRKLAHALRRGRVRARVVAKVNFTPTEGASLSRQRKLALVEKR